MVRLCLGLFGGLGSGWASCAGCVSSADNPVDISLDCKCQCKCQL